MGTSHVPPPPTVPPLEIGIRCLKSLSKFDKDHSTVILEAKIEFMTLLKNGNLCKTRDIINVLLKIKVFWIIPPRQQVKFSDVSKNLQGQAVGVLV